MQKPIESHNSVIKLMETEKEQNTAFLKLVQGFAAFLNTNVDSTKLEEHPIVKGVYYLPISFMESTLDSLFFGLWETVNFRWERILNEIVASIDLRVYHPIAKIWITRVGVGATDIKVDKIPDELKKKMTREEINGWHIDPSNKKPYALGMGSFATLKAFCFKNACLSLGKSFGRDANRDLVSNYERFLKKTSILELRMKVSTLLDFIQDKEEAEKLRSEILEAEASGNANENFYTDIIKKYERNTGDN